MDNLPDLSAILKRRAIPAIATLLSAIAVGAIHILFSNPTYRASTRLLVDDKTVSLSEIGQEINDSRSSTPLGATLLGTQSELIKSDRVLQFALKHVSPEPSASGFNRTRSGEDADEREELPTVDEIKSGLTVSIIPATNILELSYAHPNPTLAAALLNAIANAVVVEGAESIRSQATSVRSFLEDKIPEQQAKLQALADAEMQYRQETGIVSLDVQTEQLISSLTDVQTQERGLVTQLQDTRVRGSMLQSVTGINNLDRAYKTVRAGQNDSIRQIEANLVEVEALVGETEPLLGPNHPDMVALAARREEARSLYRQSLSTFMPGLDVPSSLSQRLGQNASEKVSQDLVIEYITGRIEQDALAEVLATVQAEKSQLEGDLALIPQYQQPLATLVRDREAAASTLTLLRTKLEEARIAEAQVADTIRIAEAAKVPDAADGSPLVILVVAAMAGAVLAVGVILLLEAVDDRIHGVEDLEAIAQLPVFGTLPKGLPQHPSSASVRHLLQNNQWTECYRLLFKALAFHSQQQPTPLPNTFVFSGLKKHEGQVLSTTHLAVVAARLRRKSLLIDANWQQPVQHLFFEVAPRPGLTQLFERSDFSDPQVLLKGVQRSRVLDRDSTLDVLPYGAMREGEDTWDTLSERSEMQALLTAASAQYDFTAIIAPAVETCADAAALGSHGAALVLVVQANVTSKSMLVRSLKKLEKSGTQVAGLVIAQTLDPLDSSYPIEAASPPAFSAPSAYLNHNLLPTPGDP